MMISPPKKPKIKEEKNKGQIIIEALWPNYGITIGNALRRVLLSSIEGCAVTKVRIKGVPHEFCPIEGVLEDALSLCQNLKGLRFKMVGREPQKVTLKAKGEMEIRGKDLILPAQLELVNKDHYIATLTSKKSQLELEFWVEKGVGYLPKEMMGEEEPGEIFLDAVFSPIKKVAVHVENMRVGKRTDFDRLILEIETDGTVSPKEAFLKACQILKDQFEYLMKDES